MATDSSGNWMNPDDASSGPGGSTYALLGAGIAGLGLEAYGAASGIKASKEYNAASVDKIQHEQSIEQQKYQGMILMNDRQNKQNLRNVQRARSLSLASAVGSGQGAGSFSGSGLSGSQGAESAQGAVNALGLNQNLEIGKNIFGQQSSISQNKIAMANSQVKSQESSAWGGLGKDLLSAAPTIAKFATMFI